MKEIEKHENLKQCAIYSYGKNNDMPNGYELIGLFSNDRNGLQASVIKHEKEIIISFRGTNFELSRESLHDAKNDYQMWKKSFLNKLIVLCRLIIIYVNNIRMQKLS